MPVQPTYPGVYIEEVPSGVRPIAGVATSVTAFVGRAKYGPVNEPTSCSTFGEYDRRFGGLWIDKPLPYAVDDFFANGGSKAVIVRFFKPNDPINDPGIAGLSLDNLEIVAANPGDWGNQLKVTVKYSDDPKATKEFAKQYNLTENDFFDLFIKDQGTGREETIRNVSIDDKAAARRVDRVLSAQSSLIRVKLDGNGDPLLGNARPADDSNGTGQNGNDGASLSDVDIIGSENKKTGIYSLLKTDIFNILCIPPDSMSGDTPQTVWEKAAEFCQKRRAFLIVDPPVAWDANPDTAVATVQNNQKNTPVITNLSNAGNAALFFPRTRKPDLLREGQVRTFVPCGAIAGVMARTDTDRGVWKAPAGIEASLGGVQELTVKLTDSDNGALNPMGINCLRSFPVFGRVVWGARTLRGSDQLADDYKYTPVKRLALFIEESLYRGTQWVVFEPNDEPLWALIRLNVGSFMQRLFRQGAFQGSSPKEAYLVKCDKDTTTQDDINLGIVNIVVGFAPLQPAEFVFIYIQQIRNAA